jgi:NTE family protein
VHAISGTSMGSLVGGFYATGMDATELRETVEAIDFEELFQDATRRQDQTYRRKRDDDLALFGPKLGVGRNSELLPRGAVHGQKISYLFETLVAARTRERSFDRLPIPYRAVAADIQSGAPVVLAEGSLSLAMRSSMSVPGVFSPVEWDDYLLVDGGIANNLPVDVVRALGADVVIAVEVGTPPAGRDQLKNMAQYVGQLSNLMIANNTRAQIATLGTDDTLIRPALGDEIGSAEFAKATEAIEIGYAAALAASAELSRYSVSEAVYAEYRRTVESCVAGPAKIQFVEIENRSRFSDDVIEHRMRLATDTPVDEQALRAGVERVYGLGFLDLVRHEVVERDGSTGARVTVDQDARGTNFLEWGLDLTSDGDDTDLNLRVAYLKTDLDEYGSELRILTQLGDAPGVSAELYKALGPELRWFLRPHIAYEMRDFLVYDDRGNPDDIVDANQLTGELALLLELSDRSAISTGVRFYDGEASDEFGMRDQLQEDYRGGEWLVGFDHDSIDDRYFPRTGNLARLGYTSSEPSLGADESFEQATSVIAAARTWGNHTLIGRLRYNTTLNGQAPYYAQFRAGGLFEISGLNVNEVGGDHYGIALGSWRYQLSEGGGFFPAMAGVSLEYGNVSNDRSDLFSDAITAGSLYFSYRSPIGPLYWGVGLAEGGERAYFLRIGDVFSRSSITR